MKRNFVKLMMAGACITMLFAGPARAGEEGGEGFIEEAGLPEELEEAADTLPGESEETADALPDEYDETDILSEEDDEAAGFPTEDFEDTVAFEEEPFADDGYDWYGWADADVSDDPGDDWSEDDEWTRDDEELTDDDDCCHARDYDFDTIRMYVLDENGFRPFVSGQEVKAGDIVIWSCAYVDHGLCDDCMELLQIAPGGFPVFGMWDYSDEACEAVGRCEEMYTGRIMDEYADLPENMKVDMDTIYVSKYAPDGTYSLTLEGIPDDGNDPVQKILEEYSVVVTGNEKTADVQAPELVSLSFDKDEFRANENLEGTIVFRDVTGVGELYISMVSNVREWDGAYRTFTIIAGDGHFHYSDENGLVTFRFSITPSEICPWSYEDDPVYKVQSIWVSDQRPNSGEDDTENGIWNFGKDTVYANTDAFERYEPDDDEEVIWYRDDTQIRLTSPELYQWSPDEVWNCCDAPAAGQKQTVKDWLNVKGTLPMCVKQTYKGVRVRGLGDGDHIKEVTSDRKKILKVKWDKKSGKITLKAGKKTGKAKVTVTLASGLKKSFTVRVRKKKVKTGKINIAIKTRTIPKGSSLRLDPVVNPLTSQEKVKYASSSKKVASVSRNGTVKAKKKGTARITIRSGKKKTIVKITVR